MSKPVPPSDVADKFMLRMPEGMREILKGYAERNQRSMNAEIIARLLETLEPWKPGDEIKFHVETKQNFKSTKFNIDEMLDFMNGVTDKLRVIKENEK